MGFDILRSHLQGDWKWMFSCGTSLCKVLLYFPCTQDLNRSNICIYFLAIIPSKLNRMIKHISLPRFSLPQRTSEAILKIQFSTGSRKVSKTTPETVLTSKFSTGLTKVSKTYRVEDQYKESFLKFLIYFE